jgi:beta-N-acetylhexosaminidase
LYTALDSELPATLSSTVINGLLRTELGYEHGIISDALDMGAMKLFPAEQVGTRYIKAGGDLLCVAQPKTQYPVQHAIAMAEDMLRALEDGSLKQSEIDKSQSRIRAVLDYSSRIQQDAGPSPQLAVLSCEEHASLRAKLA